MSNDHPPYNGPRQPGERYADEIEWEAHMNGPFTIPGARWDESRVDNADLVIPHVSRLARFEGDETVVALVDGCTIRSGGDEDRPDCIAGGYVRIVDETTGEDVGYWTAEEWAEDPILVMGAMLNCAAGARLDTPAKV